MKVYVSGPMSGIPQFNFPAFERATLRLRELGYDVVAPQELDEDEYGSVAEAARRSEDGNMLDLEGATGRTWGDLLSRDVKLIADHGVEAIVALKGWEKSRGARLEVYIGLLCDLPIYYYSEATRNITQLFPSIVAYDLTEQWRTVL